MINYPTSLDDFVNPSSTDKMDSAVVPHSEQHSNLNDAVEALQAKVGVNGSTDVNSLDYKVAHKVDQAEVGATNTNYVNVFLYSLAQ